MDPQFITVVGIALVVLAVSVQIAYYVRSRSMVKRWAEQNGLRVMAMRKSMFRRGPFLFSGKSRPVYRILVMDANGAKREGWVRCGTMMMGILSDHVDVEWD